MSLTVGCLTELGSLCRPVAALRPIDDSDLDLAPVLTGAQL